MYLVLGISVFVLFLLCLPFSSSHPDHSLVSNLLFWQDVTEYGAAEDRAADRLLRMCNAWAIYNRFICDDSQYNIGK